MHDRRRELRDPPSRGRGSPSRGARTGAAALLLALAAATGCTPAPVEPGEDGRYTIVLGDSYPVGHPISEHGAEYFMERAEKLSGGRITFEYYPSEQMGAADELIDFTGAGVVDMASVAPAYVPAKLPMSGVADLPGMVSSSCEGALATEALMSEGGVLFEEEFQRYGVRPLVIGLIPSYELMTGSTEVTAPDQAQGMQLRSSGGTIDGVVTSLGASPVSMPAPEMYEAISRGTVDGTVLAPLSALPYRLDEAARHSTLGANLGSFTNTYSISEDVWDGLPADLRDALGTAGRDTTRHLCAALDEENTASRKSLAEGGMVFHRLTGTQRERWAEVTGPAQRQWAEHVESIGRPGSDALDSMHDELERVRDDRE
ncbi:TRAP-type C4-dicarboxylate transport system substrate-binding protein [Murinocardiopsis flavida]|uniref:TRAP-type C4-dicarboxylate transport system substrate-binding protein n=1 Tax=Murinocardiopsis flavida TaxID=645275 RepID=A0A2P8CXF8_9ACTN|nr:TRAP transporter substrate-binding protein DctP [Murinocardiopsis flavida]PSK89658.1 TRAP-type C4-dicarboxylate transport system substrate-binding protein [Murinocardiopsis flavida]